MGFKEDLLKRITINDLVGTIGRTVGPADSGLKVDKKSMERLLAMTCFKHHREREIDLYLRPLDDVKYQILVLDNELPLFETTLADVLLRRNPTVKEMISVRNAIKILNDKDVVKFRRAGSLTFLQEELLESLDLSFCAADLEVIFNEAVAFLEKQRVEDVVQAIVLFAEILGYLPAPSQFKIKGQRIWGRVSKDTSGRKLFGPMVIYNTDTNRLIFWPEPVESIGSGVVEHLKQALDIKRPLWTEGSAVFALIRDKAIEQGAMASL